MGVVCPKTCSLAEFASADAKEVRSFLREHVSRKNTAQFTNVRPQGVRCSELQFPLAKKGHGPFCQRLVNYFGNADVEYFGAPK